MYTSVKNALKQRKLNTKTGASKMTIQDFREKWAKSKQYDSWQDVLDNTTNI